MSDGALTKSGAFLHDNGFSTPPGDSIYELLSLRGKTVIVTGAAGGIARHGSETGSAVHLLRHHWASQTPTALAFYQRYCAAQAYAELGANVAICYNTNERAAERAAAIEKKFNVKCRAYQLDVRSYPAVQSTIDHIVTNFGGRLDVFVANAGIPWTQGAALGGDVSHYLDVVKVDLDGVYYCALAAGRHFRRQFFERINLDGKPLGDSYRGGSFIATASISGRIANIPQLQAAYNAAKAGVAHLCKSLAIEWIRFARVNTISPGYINTEISDFIPAETKKVWRDKIPMGREASPTELKGAYVYLATAASSYTTGLDLVVDGGYTVV